MSKAKTEKPKKSTYKPPVLKHLGALNGKWKVNGSIKDEPDTKIKGWESYEWMKGGFFMIMRWKIVTKQKKHKDVDRGMMVIGLDDKTKGCTGRSYGSSGTVTDYKINVQKGNFGIKGTDYVFEGTFSKDRKSVEGTWKQKAENGKWQYWYNKRLKKKKRN